MEMGEIIKSWLLNRLGVVIDFSSERFTECMKSGKLIADILHNYGIFSSDQVHDVVFGKVDRLELYKVYLSKVDVLYNESIHEEVLCGNLNACIKLLYGMYFALQCKDKLTTIAVQKRKQILGTKNEKFNVTPVCEENSKIQATLDESTFSKPLTELAHIIEWHKEKQNVFLKKCRDNRVRYIEYLREKFKDKLNKSTCINIVIPKKGHTRKCVMPKRDMDVESTNLCYEELLKEEMSYKNNDVVPNVNEAEQILNTIKNRIRNKQKVDQVSEHMHKLLLKEFWEYIMQFQEKKFVGDITKRVLKQSIFERQMVTKIFEVRQQKQTILENRCIIDQEIQKKQEEEFFSQIFHDEIVRDDKEKLYYFEKKRTLELHTRLYKEKQKLRAAREYNMCFDIVNDMCDVASYYTEYSMHFGFPTPTRTKRDLGTLFAKEQSIYNLLKQVEDIVVYDTFDLPSELELIFKQELSRQSVLDDNNFDDYCNIAEPFSNPDPEVFSSEQFTSMTLGLHILGNLVHRLLLAKYPRPSIPPIPNIPKVTIRACINGLMNLSILPAMVLLLEERNIKVIQIQDALNYCLQMYKIESTVNQIENILEDKKDPGKRNKNEKTIKKKGEKSQKKKQKSTSDIIDIVNEVVTFENKIIQTPKLFPDEELVLSPAGELGSAAYVILNRGDQLNDYLIVAMLVQYLISLNSQNINGWVLINYPETMKQACLLEEALTSVPVPIDYEEYEGQENVNDYTVLETRKVPENTPVIDKNAEKRKIKLLPNPNSVEKYYETYFSAFITLEQIVDDKDWHYDYFLKDPAPKTIHEFYHNQGCHYYLYYTAIDFKTLKHLGKLIIGDYSIPPKSSVEILGPSVEYLEAHLNVEDGFITKSLAKVGKKQRKVKSPMKGKDMTTISAGEDNKFEKKSKISMSSKGKQKQPTPKKENKEKIKSSKDSGKNKIKPDQGVTAVITHMDKETQMPDSDDDVQQSIDYIYPRPGEQGWIYISCSIPNEFQIVLATLWENIAEIYSNDFKELFFRKRSVQNTIVPFVSYVRKHMEKFITRPDCKQKYLHDFQVMYNSIDDDLRDDIELKAEVHCRIYEFRNKLFNICDSKMQANESERINIIEDNWVVKCVCELTSIIIESMQLELDRHADSLYLIHEYYHGMVKKLPSLDIQIKKLVLPIPVYEEQTPLKPNMQKLIDFTDTLLRKVETVDLNRSPYHNIVNQNYQTSLHYCEDNYQYSKHILLKLSDVFKPKDVKKGKKVKPKKDKSSKRDPKKLPEFLVPEPSVVQVSARLINEYSSCVEGEMDRMKFRLTMLYEAATRDLDDVLNSTSQTFHGIYDDIAKRYERETNSINTACSILARAVETEVKIQPELLLSGDEFFVEPDVLLFENPLPDMDPLKEELRTQYVFSLNQLNELVTVLNNIAISGCMPERAFVYLLQDMISCNAEDGQLSPVPIQWSRMTPRDVDKLSFCMFGPAECIDWRDFILFNCDVQFPTIGQIISLCKHYRDLDPDLTEYVTEDQFHSIKFWFENADNIDHDKKLKRLLWRCFQVDDSRINYTSLLLAFCKDSIPEVGLVKALSIALGKTVCGDSETGNGYIDHALRNLRKKIEEERIIGRDKEDTETMAQELISILAEKSVHLGEGPIIEEIVSVDDTKRSQSEKKSHDTGQLYNKIKLPNLKLLDISSTDITKSINTISHDQISNVEVGYETKSFPAMVYTIDFELLIAVLSALFPWHMKMQSINTSSLHDQLKTAYEQCRHDELNVVFSHKLISNPIVKDIIRFKCSVQHPAAIVCDIIDTI